MMHSRRITAKLLPVAVGSLLVAGCDKAGSAAAGQRNPLVMQARQAVEARDFEGAASLYRQTLDSNPRLAQAHLEFGLLCDERLGDPVSAIYHYRRYLELQPNSEQRQLVEDYIQRARLMLAAQLAQVPGAEPAELRRLREERAALVEENAMLKGRLAELQKSPPPVAPTALSATQPVAEPARPKTHVVQKGDTLHGIALRYYGTRAAWTRILEANSSVLTNKDQLKIGQELVLP